MAAAGAMAAPMLFASVMPRSSIVPIVTARTNGPTSPFSRTAAPAAVAVHWAVGVRWPPYSSGRRNCRSAEQKWDEVQATARVTAPASRKTEETARLSAIVEQAPNSPMKGMPSARMP